MQSSIQAYPLHWPKGWPEKDAKELLQSSRFRVTPDGARKGMLNEIKRLVGHNYNRSSVVISSNIRLRQDGEPYASQREPENKGVAVYFQYNDKPMVFACDQWPCVHDNMHAISKTIEALRGIERWGASDMLERAFTGFIAIENLVGQRDNWEDVLEMDIRDGEPNRSWLVAAEKRFMRMARTAHPDHGGTAEKMSTLLRARDDARASLTR